MKKILFFPLALFVCLPAFSINMSWTNDFANGAYMYDSDGTTKLIAGATGNDGDFIQLIKINPTFSILSPDLSKSDAVDISGNTLIDSSFIGAVLGTDGEFEVPAKTYSNVNPGDVLFLRIWNLASPSFNSGNPISSQAPIPLNGIGSVSYGDSATYTIENLPTVTYFVPDTSTTMLIPEPTTIAVLLMGFLGLVGFRKHLRK